MRNLAVITIAAAVPLLAAAAHAADGVQLPVWAYPVMDAGRDRGPDDGTIYTREGSTLRPTQTQINDAFAPPDWYPNDHPPMPEVVAHGRRPLVRACGQCHMPHGLGHPESANLAGLSADYIFQQMKDYQTGARKSLVPARSNSMIEIAGASTDEEIRIAAEYFANLPRKKWNRLVEAAMVPVTFVGAGNMRHAEPNGGMEPIGNRIIEIPEDSHGAELRDGRSPFIAYVPPGSIAKGQELAMTGGGGKTIPCGICHGPDFRGLADVPGLAGRSPVYMVRQMMDIKHGARAGTKVALMKAVVANLSEDDMLVLAAYMGSLDP